MNRLPRYGLLGLLPLSAVFGQTSWSAQAFFEHYYVASHSDTTNNRLNGFQFRRIYLTYNHQVDDRLSVRLRFEAANADFTARSVKATPFVKDAYLQWHQGSRMILFGIMPTPTFGLVEPSWGYRSVAKTPSDMHGFGKSRDFGIAIKGKIASRLGYHFMLGNGNANASEDDIYKKFFGSFNLPVGEKAIVEGYVESEQDDASITRLTLQFHMQFNLARFHIGTLAIRSTETDGLTEIGKRDLVSLYLRSTSGSKLNLFGRVDYLLEPNARGHKISYTPMSTLATPMVLIAGADYKAHANVSLQPNIMVVLYSVESGDAPSSDIYLRLTGHFKR